MVHLSQPPQAERRPVTRSFHGRTFTDEYEWLRDKESPETRAYLEAENQWTEQRTEHLEGLRTAVFEEIRSRVKETDMSVPVRAGNYWYYGRTEEGQEYGYSCRIPVAEGQDPWVPPQVPSDGSPVPGEQVLLDLNTMAEGESFFSLGASSVTTSGRYLAYSQDTTGDERFTLYVKDLDTGELLPDVLSNVHYGATWAGEEYLFYTTVDDAWRPDRVWRHRLGTPQSQDVEIHHEADERFGVDVGSTRSEEWLMIVSGSKTVTETRVLPMADPEGAFTVLWERAEGVEYDVDHAVVAGESRWVVTHNALGPNFAVGECAAVTGDALPALAELKELVPHSSETRVEGVDVFHHQIVVAYRKGAIGRAAIMTLTDSGYGAFEELDFPEELYTVAVSGNPEWEAPVLRFLYTSFTTPAQLYDLRVDTGERTLLKEQEVLGDFRAENYTASRRWVEAADGAQIPVSLVHRVDVDPAAGPHPCLLYGYGAYESSVDPGFSVSRLSLLDRGMIFAVAHVRGGGEMGRGWYEGGRLTAKRNTFTDFIAVADQLIADGITSPDRLVAEGGSAGGLLVGAVANMAPDRFRGILAVVPFVDALTSILKPELPLTIPEWEEWGDPYHDPEVYHYMASYSPYENVVAQDYPDILACTSLNDTRVLYVEPAKWVAKLRATATGGEILLKTEMSAGHGGVSGRYKGWRETAYHYAWVINEATGLEA